jgi:hypothetical protein
MATLRYVAILVLGIILAGCGGSGKTPQPTQTSAAVRPSPTYSIYGATWTPAPSPTPVVQPTLAYTYQPPPTGTAVYLPTRPPTEIPPTFDALAATAQAANALIQGEAATNTALLLSASLLNDAAAEILAPVVGSFIAAPPEITFDQDRVFVAMDVVVRGTGGVAAPRPVVLEISVHPADDAIRLVKEDAYYTDDDTPYTDPVGDFVLGSVDTAFNNVLRDRYAQSNPGGGAFSVAEVKIALDGLTVRTDAVAN